MQMSMTDIASNWLEIDGDVLRHNITYLMRQGSNKSKKAILMLKANAYGHGLLEVASIVAHSDISMFALASIEDAAKLRKAGVTQPILVVGSLSERTAHLYEALSLTASVDSFAALEYMTKSKADLRFHIKIDTGLHRYGFSVADIPLLLQRLQECHLRPSGIYTHFSDANTNLALTKKELAAFRKTVETFQAEGFTFDYIHASNSAGTLWLDESFTNAVRLGLAAYGLQPDTHTPASIHPCLSWKTRIDAVRLVEMGETAGYGQAWRASRKTRLGILTVGYSDGLRARPKHPENVLCNGQTIPIVGNVMMNNTMIDITDCPEVKLGDIVTIIGKDREAIITLEDIASQVGTINEEIASQIQASVERRVINL